MTLFQMTRLYSHAILVGTFLVSMLHSSMLMAASAEEPALPLTDSAAIPVPRTPAIAIGHEAMYRRFLEGRLEYRPNPKSDAGLITLFFRDILIPIAGSENPLSATFDLSLCGDAWKYITINIGYKKEKVDGDVDKIQVWICPWFLVKQELDKFKVGGGMFSSPKHPFADIMHQWESPIGYFWTWGGHNVKKDNYDCLLKNVAMDNSKNIHEKWLSSPSALPWPTLIQSPIQDCIMQNFTVIL